MSWRGVDDFLERIDTRLDPVYGPPKSPIGGDTDLLDEQKLETVRPAGVLIGVVDRGQNDLNVVLTLRPDTMPSHAGQVAFPGGKKDATDPDIVHTALREAQEEVGIIPGVVQLKGRSGRYVTGTGFRITPVIGVLPPDFEPNPDPIEVAKVFETPLSFLMDPRNHQRKETVWQGRNRSYLVMPHDGNYIWGVTAGIIRALYERLYDEGG